MPSIPCRSLQSLLMGGSKCIPVRCSAAAAAAAAVAAFVPRRLLHFRIHLRAPHFRGPVYSNLLFCQRSFRACNHFSVPVTASNAGLFVATVEVARPGNETTSARRIAHLKTKMKKVGIQNAACIPGGTTLMLCPMCRGGTSMEKSLVVCIHENGDLATWACKRGECGWEGEVQVEGEIDKLSMEEAGYRNCVSVPDGAPAQVSKKSPAAAEEASRIILATDADGPGQALAEELARRLGKERFGFSLSCFIQLINKKAALYLFNIWANSGVGGSNGHRKVILKFVKMLMRFVLAV
ncbi:hypothetical protein B296_00057011 [Ensete ventricosum]|uniref:Toprim domain-containing protein n=1 Tax=Ensete ventricosum TaxID=4639 RepID=A0A426X7A2_ENSVE|nr:hypothetical protein B296_00057011 [Ensete ventricosum]